MDETSIPRFTKPNRLQQYHPKGLIKLKPVIYFYSVFYLSALLPITNS